MAAKVNNRAWAVFCVTAIWKAERLSDPKGNVPMKLMMNPENNILKYEDNIEILLIKSYMMRIILAIAKLVLSE
jgi:hypothetical protein